ncbi:Uncharacterised protein [Legionella cincinnatiensis]|uniref:Uncharacterized protein n=1 Tax=Legionella cincinnatiensis TaxID=28085 RepID=A0A378IG45_9GAMM|nr:hypothetical protein Lcin_1004 [Legionella cincinnatiensis]STX33471.1 Uncharacterised protein [Legionella cincinnatiensis]
MQLKYDIDLFSIKNDVSNTAYCNCWVGNELFWEKYMAFTLPIYYYILYESPLDLRNTFLKKRADKKINAAGNLYFSQVDKFFRDVAHPK